MAKIYGFKRFKYQTAHRVDLTATVATTNTFGEANNPGWTSVMHLGRKDVGAVISVDASNVGTVLAEKPAEFDTTVKYYLLAEVPVPATNDDYHFVGIPLEHMGDIDNLIERRPQGDWATQFANLRKEGAK